MELLPPLYPKKLLVPRTEHHLSSFKCDFLNIFSRQNLLRSLSLLLFLLWWSKYGAKKRLKNHIPFDFWDDSTLADQGAWNTIEKPLKELPWNQQLKTHYCFAFQLSSRIIHWTNLRASDHSKQYSNIRNELLSTDVSTNASCSCLCWTFDSSTFTSGTIIKCGSHWTNSGSSYSWKATVRTWIHTKSKWTPVLHASIISC